MLNVGFGMGNIIGLFFILWIMSGVGGGGVGGIFFVCVCGVGFGL